VESVQQQILAAASASMLLAAASASMLLAAALSLEESD
jgi:hypothetical protein